MFNQITYKKPSQTEIDTLKQLTVHILKDGKPFFKIRFKRPYPIDFESELKEFSKFISGNIGFFESHFNGQIFNYSTINNIK